MRYDLSFSQSTFSIVDAEGVYAGGSARGVACVRALAGVRLRKQQRMRPTMISSNARTTTPTATVMTTTWDCSGFEGRKDSTKDEDESVEAIETARKQCC